MADEKVDEVPRLGIPELYTILDLAAEIRYDAVQAAKGVKVAKQRIRKKLMQIRKLSLVVRKALAPSAGKETAS